MILRTIFNYSLVERTKWSLRNCQDLRSNVCNICSNQRNSTIFALKFKSWDNVSLQQLSRIFLDNFCRISEKGTNKASLHARQGWIAHRAVLSPGLHKWNFSRQFWTYKLNGWTYTSLKPISTLIWTSTSAINRVNFWPLLEYINQSININQSKAVNCNATNPTQHVFFVRYLWLWNCTKI